ncbi:MAG: hypothetical protein KOO60_05985 [Gemmatimonadales bacterium]|nr:hypothetical protein [Gemmatimonadales bacterium]
MSFKIYAALLLLGLVIVAAPCLAQDQETASTFKLLRDSKLAEAELDLETEEGFSWERAIKGRDLEFSFALGFLDLNTTLMAHDQIVYKYTPEYTYWGDVVLTGQSAFAPVVRMGYSINKWLSLEGNASLSFSEYTSQITDAKSRKNEPLSPVNEDIEVGEFDPEHRSLITFLGGGNLLLYPLNIMGEGKGLLQPFLTTGFGRLWYDINSDYSAGMVSTNNFNFGGGLRLLGDERISLRIELLYHKNTVEFEPAKYYLELDQGTTLILLEEHPEVNGVRVDQVVDSFQPQDINSLNWSIGFQGTF